MTNRSCYAIVNISKEVMNLTKDSNFNRMRGLPMDRYEFDIKIEQIKKLMKKKDFATAVKIADSIEWKKVKENPLLVIAADVYEISGKYDEAREVLLLAYEKTGLGRQLAYRLCRLSIKRGDFKEAEEFYDEFTHNSPYDAGKYILQYEMAKGKGESLDAQISILETFIGEDMDDRWAYELAKLYHKAHLSEKCVEICDTIILWFADGKYVEKALELKQLYVPLSENQRLKYEAQKSNKDRMVAAAVQEMVDNGEVTEVITESAEKEQVAEAVEIVEATEDENAEVEADEEADEEVEAESEILDQVHEPDIDVNAIHVKDFSVNNSYDTINIQKELAKSVSTLFDNTIEIFKPVAPKSSSVEEEVVDDQIEGQMSLDEVLAMFESGELSTRSEETEASEAEAVDEEFVEEVLEDIVEETTEEAVEEDIVEETAEEDLEDVVEEISEDAVEDILEESEFEEVEESTEDAVEEPTEEMDEVEALSQIIAKEIEAEMAEEIADVIDEANEERAFNMFDLSEEMEDIEDEEFESEESEEETDEIEEIEETEEFEDEEFEDEIEDVEDSDEVEDDDLDEDVEDSDEVEDDEILEDSDDSDEDDEESEEESKEEVSKATPAPTSNAVKQADIAKRELKKFISKFTGIKGLDKQILKVLQTALKGDEEPVKFIFVKGEIRSGKTTLAIEVIKVINRIIQRKDQKIAKIKGISINEKSIESLLEALGGNDILIERVSDMDIDVFIEFVEKLKEDGKPRVVIFEDEKTLAEAYLEELPEEYANFTNVIDIKLNEIRDWATIAENYAKERGYSIDAMGTLALSAKIDQLRAVTLVIHKSHIEQLIDEAILDAEKFSLKNLFGKLFGKKETGLKPLTEKNFIK